jgi:hypothetical protein
VINVIVRDWAWLDVILTCDGQVDQDDDEEEKRDQMSLLSESNELNSVLNEIICNLNDAG